MKLYYVKIEEDWDDLKEESSVVFKLPTSGIYYRIYNSRDSKRWWLTCSGNNSQIFDILKVNGESFVKSVVGYSRGGDFPEVNSLADLKKVIKALDDECVKKFGIPDSKSKKDSDFKEGKEVQPSELKAGDYIRISDRNFTFIYIFKEYKNDVIYRYVNYDLDTDMCDTNGTGCWGGYCSSYDKITYATEEEKRLLNDALLEKGYIWDNVNKKLVEVGSANLTTTEQSDLDIADILYDTPSTIAINKYVISNDGLYTEKIQEEPKEELNLFPTKKHYQLNFNY